MMRKMGSDKGEKAWLEEGIESISKKLLGDRGSRLLSYPAEKARQLFQRVLTLGSSGLFTPGTPEPQRSLRPPGLVVKMGLQAKAVAVTYRCNIRCPNCYVSQLETRFGDITIENFRIVAEWIASTGTAKIKLMGGEPTIHPHLDKLLEEVEKVGCRAFVFTNGLYSERVQDILSSFNLEGVWVNFSHITRDQTEKIALMQRNMERLAKDGLLASYSYVVDEDCPWGEEFIDISDRMGVEAVSLLPAIDLDKGLSPGYANIMDNIASMVVDGHNRGLPISVVTPIAKCYLRPEVEKLLLSLDPWMYYTRCTIGFAGDYTIRSIINPNLTAFPCPATFMPSPPITELRDYNDLNLFFKDKVVNLMKNPPHTPCQTCQHHLELLKSFDEVDPDTFFDKNLCNSMCLQYHRDFALGHGLIKPVECSS